MVVNDEEFIIFDNEQSNNEVVLADSISIFDQNFLAYHTMLQKVHTQQKLVMQIIIIECSSCFVV